MPQGTCSIDDCNRPLYGRGWCNTHYARWRRHGDPEHGGPIGRQTGTGQPCSINGCTAPVVASALCEGHYRRFKRWVVNRVVLGYSVFVCLFFWG